MSTTTQILFNSNALQSLKHKQLVDLCKIHSIEHIGKKAELVERLQKHGSTLPRKRAGFPEIDDDASGLSDEGTLQWHGQPRQSEAWEVLESIEEVEERSSQGTLNSMRGVAGASGEFGTGASKSGSVTSSIRALANSLGIKKSTSNKSLQEKALLPTSKESDQLGQTSVPYSSIPANPLLPETDHFILSELDEPLPGQAARIGLPAAPGARLSLSAVPGHAPSTPSRRGATTTIRLVSNSATVVPSIPQTPQLKPFKTTFDLTMDTPMILNKAPRDRDQLYPNLPSPPPQPPKVLTADDMDVDMPGSFGFNQPALLQPPEPFMFGSPRSSAAAFTFSTPGGAAKMSVLDEMNQRLAQQGIESVPHDIFSIPKTSVEASLNEHEKQASTSVRFDSLHEAEESKMESIASWTQKRERLGNKNVSATKKRKSSVLNDASSQPKKSRVSIKEAARDEDDVENRRLSKRPRVSTVEGPDSAADSLQKEKDREAVKRMLERNKQKRRSSMGAPRASIGKAPPPKPKSRFGFLSSAKTLVQSVWSRNQNASKPSPMTSSSIPVAKTNPPPELPKQKSTPAPKLTATPVNPQSLRAPSVGSSNSRARSPLPSFAGETASSVASNGSRQSQEVSGSSRVSSLGTRIPTGGRRSSTLVPKAQRVSSGGKLEIKSHARVSAGSSRLLAPTASSLAKRQSTDGDSKRTKSQQPSSQAVVPSRIPVSSPPTTGRIFHQPLQSPPPSSIPVLVSSPIRPTAKMEEKVAGSSEVPSLGKTGRKPRISRSKVIAKLASKRAAGEGVVGRQSVGKTRSSLGAAAGARASHGGSRKSDAAISAAKKRSRQSEVNRRRSKAPRED